MKRAGLLIIVVALGGFSACSINKDEKKLSYEYEYNGCNTGKQEYGSMDEMCRGLLDDARNNYCASSLRAQAYQQQCQATTGVVFDESLLEEGDF